MVDPTSIKGEILEMTGEHVEQLHSMWSLMFEPKTCEDFLHKLKAHADNFYTDLLTESREKQAAILDDIAALRAEASDLTRLLHETVDIGQRPDDVPLIIWQLKLDKSIEHLREELSKRRAEIGELLLQQEQLCEELGALPLPLLADPLPLPDEMDGFRDHLDNLRSQRAVRQTELDQLRKAIKHDMKMLELMPQTDAEDRLLNDLSHNLTPETLERLRQMRNSYAEQIQELRSKIHDMREKIYVLWDRLQETDESAMRRVRECTENTQRTYDILHSELQRCQALRSQNPKTFIEQLRVEISKWWDLTLKSQQERKRFSNYYNKYYNEDLLELHELELDDLKSFYTCNKEIFDLYESRAELWSRMQALEAKANEPNRFKNRGGQLLKEEKERKAISKLPKIEQQITELVHAYEVQSHGPFLVYGENILELMAGEWENYRQAKQSSARKKAPPTTRTGSSSKLMMPPPTAGSTAPRTPRTLKNMSSMSTSTMSLRKTPTIQLITPNMTKSTGNLHKRLNPSAAASSSGYRLANSQLKASKSPLRRVRVLDNTLRRSGGLGRRSLGTRSKKKPRTKSAVPDTRSPSDSEYMTDETTENDREAGISYDEFVPTSRSSVLPVGGAQHQRNRVAVPRIRHVLVNHNSVASAANTPSKQAVNQEERPRFGNQLKLPSPRESRMWPNPR
ncbi:protein regulator of cytokinesis 1-like [Drosophila miranda]|uniref:protein regulator of cytokinesis 1-like n=1 Tax=Drosophila miranda TaxID=7229 RepID=UPI00143F57E1|nr:protein regulator of cytokinesis 1-like [Drosophila miranda]XP_033248274.1 protein regulator of cytokinesis 1-like [Drosophila miranda]